MQTHWTRDLGGTRMGGLVEGLGLTQLGVRLASLARYTLYALLLVASLMFYVWSRVDVRASAAALDSAAARYEALQAEQERLHLELAARRDLGRLSRVGAAMGLVADAEVRTLAEVRR